MHRPAPRSRTEALERAQEPVGRSTKHPRGEDEPVPGKARAEMLAGGRGQGERRPTPQTERKKTAMEIAQDRARANMNRS
jgi:hypothetical protein